ncbi:MAG: SRPBCC family protein [Verrucomicrobiota bacterium]
MPAFRVEKSIVINAPAEKVYGVVRDFKEWVPWSPWLIAEPGCSVSYADDGMSYSWDGKIIGSGGMTLLEVDAPRAMRYRLNFLKPWKSESAVAFDFVEKDGGTEVTWSMDGSLPFFMFWMKTMMVCLVGMDYERGLKMLKDYVETGSVPTKLEFPGEESYGGCRYVGIATECAIEKIADSMGSDFEKLGAWLEESGLQPAGPPFTIYDKWSMGKGTCGYVSGFPIEGDVGDLPSEFVTGEAPACRGYVVRHTGPYRHLGNAWSAGMMHGRAKQFSQSKKVYPFEVYENDPKTTPEGELVTAIYFPVK